MCNLKIVGLAARCQSCLLFNSVFYDIIKFYNPNESYLLLTGDLNSRTKNISEIAQTDIELLELCNIDSNDFENNDNSAYVVTTLEELGIPICRKSLDSQSNTFGHRLIELCKNNNLVILNGRVGEDQNIGNFFKNKKFCGG